MPPGENKIGSPGLPWGFETRIVNREGVELPSGEPGEVLLRGPAMMQGYYKEPEATAAVLDAEGWLHTGDLAYRDEDGYFFVVGRSKELIIKGGVNIAPRQIDEVLESHPAVLEAAAVGVPDRYLGEDFVAFVVLRSAPSTGYPAADERQLLTFCEERLGHFKTPSRIHLVQDLPKGPSGKVQRSRLLAEVGGAGGTGGGLPAALGRRPSSNALPKPGRASFASRRSTYRPIFSRWAGTRCWQFNACRGCARNSPSCFRCPISSGMPQLLNWRPSSGGGCPRRKRKGERGKGGVLAPRVGGESARLPLSPSPPLPFSHSTARPDTALPAQPRATAVVVPGAVQSRRCRSTTRPMRYACGENFTSTPWNRRSTLLSRGTKFAKHDPSPRERETARGGGSRELATTA